MVKLSLYLLLLLSALAGAYYLAIQFKVLDNPFEIKPIELLDTPTIVSEVRNMSQLISVCYFDQLVVESDPSKENMPPPVRKIFEQKKQYGDKLVLITSARIFGGCDLSNFDSTDFNIQDSVITIRLATARILDVVMNPSDITVFSETGKWSLSETNLLKTFAIQKFRNRALEKGIIQDAQTRVQSALIDFFKALGFARVEFKFKE
jgi:hypothetical protein